MKALALALTATFALAAPAAAWHVDTEPGSAEPTAKSIDPRGDPFARVVVKHKRKAIGYVSIPDENWARNTIFTVVETGATGQRGDRIPLRAGKCYTGTWSDSSEIERFCIRDDSPTAKVVWSYVSKITGERVRKRYNVPRGCVHRSGWKSVLGSTEMRMWDRANKTWLFRKQMAPPGWYKPLTYDFKRGLTCPNRIAK